MKKILLSISIVLLLAIISACSSQQEVVKEEPVITSQAPVDTVKKAFEPIIPMTDKSRIEKAYPNVSSDGRYVVFQGRNGDNWDIYMYDNSEDKLEVILSTSANESAPKLSPDNKMIAFLSDEDGMEYDGDNKSRDIYIMTIYGTGKTKLTESYSDNWGHFWTSDGKSIIYASNKNDAEQNFYDPEEKIEIFKIDVESKKIEELFPVVPYRNMPFMSENGKLVGFIDKDYKINISKGDELQVLSGQLDGYAANVTFKNDYTLLYQKFYGNNAEIREYDLNKMSVKTKIKGYNYAGGPCYDSVNDIIYFHAQRNNKYEIFKFRTEK